MNNLKEIEEKKEYYYNLVNHCFYFVLGLAVIVYILLLFGLPLWSLIFLGLEVITGTIQCIALFKCWVYRNKWWKLYLKKEDEKYSLNNCEGK